MFESARRPVLQLPRLLLLALFLIATGCAPIGATQISESRDDTTWIFRHRVRLLIPERSLDLSFDGVMRFEPHNRTAHVVGLGGLGMSLFDLRITPDAVVVNHLHPSLERMPRAVEHIAFCVRAIWFDCLAAGTPGKQTTPEQHLGVDSGWSLMTEESVDGHPWPGLMRFTGPNNTYTLIIRLIQARMESER